MARFENTISWPRFTREILKKPDLPHLGGFKLTDTITDGDPSLSVIMGPLNAQRRRGRAPSAIALSKVKGKTPRPNGDMLYRADLEVIDSEGNLEFVTPYKDGVGLRIFRTGLIPSQGRGRGGTQEDVARIMSQGKKIRQHGIFPLSPDSASLFGEGVDIAITAQSKILYDERLGHIRGAPGVVRLRETGAEVPIGGGILEGDIDGTLRIHELQHTGWVVWDVTDDPNSQKLYLDYLEAEAQRLAAIEAIGKGMLSTSPVHVMKPVRLPSDHGDA